MQMGRSALPSRIWLGACQTALHPSWLSIWYFPLSRPAHCAATLPDLWGWHISKALMGKIDAHSGQHGEGQPATGGEQLPGAERCGGCAWRCTVQGPLTPSDQPGHRFASSIGE